MFDLLLRWDPFYKCTALARREKKALQTLHSFTDSVIASRRKEIEAMQTHLGSSTTDLEFGIRRKMNLIDLLLQTPCDGRLLTDREIREEVDTFMFEGHDTTTSAISFTVYMLAKYPEAQEKAYREVCQLKIDREKELSLHTLNEMHYLELCIKETLRLFPSVPLFARKVTEDVDISKFIKDAQFESWLTDDLYYRWCPDQAGSERDSGLSLYAERPRLFSGSRRVQAGTIFGRRISRPDQRLRFCPLQCG